MSRAARLIGSTLAIGFLALSGPPAQSQEVPKAADKPQAEKPESESPGKAPSADASKEEVRAISRYLRVTRDRKGVPQSLDTSVVRFVPADGKTELAVDLVGAVHIGEKSYYRALNKAFEEYDVLLFELVMAEGTKVPDGKPRGNSMMANMVKQMLELDSQVERVDYTKKNFVHADMSPQQMGEAMRKRGDDGLTVTLSVLTEMMREANKREQKLREGKGRGATDIDLFGSLFSNDGPMRLKRMMADQMEESGDAGAFGNTLTTLLITDRNEACMKVLDREIKKGHKKIGIFYGAAHLPDFEERLTRLGYKADKTTWMTAWDLAD